MTNKPISQQINEMHRKAGISDAEFLADLLDKPLCQDRAEAVHAIARAKNKPLKESLYMTRKKLVMLTSVPYYNSIF